MLGIIDPLAISLHYELECWQFINHRYGRVYNVFEAMSHPALQGRMPRLYRAQTFGVVTMLIGCGCFIYICFLAVFVVYVCVTWPCMMDSEISGMENPATDRCGFNLWAFMPSLTELRAVHRLLILLYIHNRVSPAMLFTHSTLFYRVYVLQDDCYVELVRC